MLDDGLFSRMTGQSAGRRYGRARWLFLRALGLVYLAAFVSLWLEVQGLIGPAGILPAGDFLARVGAIYGPERYWLFPTLFWLGAGRLALHVACGLGTAAAVLLVLDRLPVVMLAVLWPLYLSLSIVGQDFLAFQWDALLLEAGLIAILFAWPGRRDGRPTGEPSPLPLLLVWWLLARLMFESGVGKLTSGDPTWRHLTALEYHFFTQPLPTWTAWYAALAPAWLDRISVALVLLLEIGGGLLVLGGVVGRRLAFAATVVLQVAIAVTGNFAFFNLLTVALALPLLDDRIWNRLLPARLRSSGGDSELPPPAEGPIRRAAGLALLGLSALTVVTTLISLPGLSRLIAVVAPIRSINGYGLFRVMTTERPEIVVEGSADGRVWTPYQFRYKPGDPSRRPRFIEPLQPRLDWQMWFAALGRFDTEPWFQAFLLRLLEGSPDVVRLLGSNPFPDAPPRFVRALLYDYRFTTPDERRRTGDWWHRRLIGEYSPVLSRRE